MAHLNLDITCSYYTFRLVLCWSVWIAFVLSIFTDADDTALDIMVTLLVVVMLLAGLLLVLGLAEIFTDIKDFIDIQFCC